MIIPSSTRCSCAFRNAAGCKRRGALCWTSAQHRCRKKNTRNPYQLSSSLREKRERAFVASCVRVAEGKHTHDTHARTDQCARRTSRALPLLMGCRRCEPMPSSFGARRAAALRRRRRSSCATITNTRCCATTRAGVRGCCAAAVVSIVVVGAVVVVPTVADSYDVIGGGQRRQLLFRLVRR